MPLLQIRNVPEDARRVLKARAAKEGKSLNAYLLEIIEREVSRPTQAEVFERIAGRDPLSISREEILQVIDEGRDERDRELMQRYEQP